ncbi:MAG: formate dehydrogenase accessory protein FdhE [Rhodoblastus sp.]|nr:formate dehydrogenase accessory protein FdhE [Rhodoblastus sp.]
MSETGATPTTPVDIGSRAEPPFAKLPEPATLFRQRAQRFAVLAQTHELAPYLHFMAGLAEAQHRTNEGGLPEPMALGEAERERAAAHGMPPVDRNRFVEDPALAATFDRLFTLAPQIDMPDRARAALANVVRMDGAERELLARAAFDNRLDPARIAEQGFVAAGMQIHAARLASMLDVKALAPVGQGACPACGGPPVASLVVGWQGAHGSRFVSCALCSTLWHEVRVKCVCCGATEGIRYQEIEDGPGAGLVRAECCATCNRYVKIMLQHKDGALDPVADDVATLALDMLLRGGEKRRGAVDPFLLGY